MKQFKIFNDPNFGEIKTALINSTPYFDGCDIATALGYTCTIKAICQHVADDDVLKVGMATVNIGSDIGIKVVDVDAILLVNENGVEALISASVHPQAKLFKEWLTSEIIPSLNKTKTNQLKSELKDCFKVLPIVQRLIESQQDFIQKTKERIVELKGEIKSITGEDMTEEDFGKSDSTEDISSELNIDPEQLSLILQKMGVVKREGDAWCLADKYKGCDCTAPKTSSK